MLKFRGIPLLMLFPQFYTLHISGLILTAGTYLQQNSPFLNSKLFSNKVALTKFITVCHMVLVLGTSHKKTEDIKKREV